MKMNLYIHIPDELILYIFFIVKEAVIIFQNDFYVFVIFNE